MCLCSQDNRKDMLGEGVRLDAKSAASLHPSFPVSGPLQRCVNWLFLVEGATERNLPCRAVPAV